MDGGVLLAEVTDDIKIVYVSPSFFKSTGRKPEELGSGYEKTFEFVHSKDIKSLKAGLMRTAKAGALLDITYRIGEHGKYWRHMRAARLPLTEGEPPPGSSPSSPTLPTSKPPRRSFASLRSATVWP